MNSFGLGAGVTEAEAMMLANRAGLGTMGTLGTALAFRYLDKDHNGLLSANEIPGAQLLGLGGNQNQAYGASPYGYQAYGAQGYGGYGGYGQGYGAQGYGYQGGYGGYGGYGGGYGANPYANYGAGNYGRGYYY